MKYHSILSSRRFMDILGLARTNHDLDEVIASPNAEWRRPWWVRSVAKPTIEIDWNLMERFDATGRIDGRVCETSLKNYTGKDTQLLRKSIKEKTKQLILENRPSFSLKNWALDVSVRLRGNGTSFIGFWENDTINEKRWRGRLFREELGIPRWEGTPEDNTRMIRAAAKYFGASQVGIVELDERIRKLIYSYDTDGVKLEFEDVDLAYETKDKRVIPNKVRWVIVFTVKMSPELLRRRTGRSPSLLSASTTGQAYTRGRAIIDSVQTFLHVLGYQGLMGTWENGLGIAPALGVMAGLGELSRTNRLISPEDGPAVRIFKVITDLPLVPDKPIDAGIMRFCRTCSKCADSCPSGTLSRKVEPSWETSGTWSKPGHRTYFEEAPRCMLYWFTGAVTCSTCISVCPFNKADNSFLHRLVKSTIAKTTVFNGIFSKMDNLLGYGMPRYPESWWDLDLPPYGIEANK